MRETGRVISRIIWILGLALCISGCRSEVHFVKEQQAVEKPSPPPSQPEILSEKFIEGLPSGTPIIDFVIHPLKSVMNQRLQIGFIENYFTSSFWKSASSYEHVQFWLERDAIDADPQTYDPISLNLPRNQWEEGGLQFFSNEMNSFRWEFTRRSLETNSPLSSFHTPLRAAAQQATPFQNPWFHFIYFRDTDIPDRAEVPAQLESEKKQFLAALDSKGISKFRYTIHLVTYHSLSTCGASEGRRAVKLQTALSELNVQLHDFCDVRDGRLSRQFGMGEAIAQAVHESHRQRILLKRPRLDTLTVKVNDTLVPRQYLLFDPTKNELSFGTDSPTLPAKGDLIEVQYEPQNE